MSEPKDKAPRVGWQNQPYQTIADLRTQNAAMLSLLERVVELDENEHSFGNVAWYNLVAEINTLLKGVREE